MSASPRTRGEVSRSLVLRSLSSCSLAQRISLAEKVLQERAVHGRAASSLLIISVARVTANIIVAVGELLLRLLARRDLIGSFKKLLARLMWSIITILEKANVTPRP